MVVLHLVHLVALYQLLLVVQLLKAALVGEEHQLELVGLWLGFVEAVNLVVEYAVNLVVVYL